MMRAGAAWEPITPAQRMGQSACPHPEQNRAPAALVRWQRGQAMGVMTGAAARGGATLTCGTFTVTLTGWPHPGTGIPSEAAIAAA
jgi:hypothetical protein